MTQGFFILAILIMLAGAAFAAFWLVRSAIDGIREYLRDRQFARRGFEVRLTTGETHVPQEKDEVPNERKE